MASLVAELNHAVVSSPCFMVNPWKNLGKLRAGWLRGRTKLIVMGDLTETNVAATSDEIREDRFFGLPDADLLQAWTQDRQQAALTELIKR